MYKYTQGKVILLTDHRVMLIPKLWPKVRKKLQESCPGGWSVRALAQLGGVGIYCYDHTCLGNLKPGWLEEVEAMLNLITAPV